MLGFRILRRDDRHHLDLVKLMLADHPPRIAARGSGLRAEARRQRGQAHRQLLFRNNLIHDEASQWNLRRRDQPPTICRAKQFIGKLGELVGAVSRRVIDQKRRRNLGIAVFLRLHVQHELAQRPFQPRQLALQHHEP